MPFIKEKPVKSEINIDVNLKPLEAKELKGNILNLINNLSLEQFELLSKVVSKPFYKKQALDALYKLNL